MFRTLLLIMIGAGSIALTSCASTNAVPPPFPRPDWEKPGTTTNAPNAPIAPGVSAPDGVSENDPADPAAPDRPLAPGSLRSRRFDGRAVAEFALGFRGVPYRLGGADPSGFD